MDKTSRQMLLVALLVGALLLLLALLALFSFYPVFGMTLMTSCYVVWCYLFTENHLVHRAQEFENRFWTVLGFVSSTCVLFIPDSPFAIGQYSVSLGFVGVVLCTFAIHRVIPFAHDSLSLCLHTDAAEFGQVIAYRVPVTAVSLLIANQCSHGGSHMYAHDALLRRSYDRHLHRSNIGRVPYMPPGMHTVASCQLLDGGTTVQQKVLLIADALAKIDSTLVATNIQHLIHGDWRRELERLRLASHTQHVACITCNVPPSCFMQDEAHIHPSALAFAEHCFIAMPAQAIIQTLADTNPDELNYILPKIKLGLIMYKIKDHPNMPNRTHLLDLLCLTRVADMTVSSRALVLDAMQQMKLTAHPRSDQYAKNVILKTRGDDLSTLKCLTDNKGDFHSMHKLIFNDIQDVKVREEVLKHIATQAAVQAAHTTLGTRTGRGRSDKAWRKILSDVDDTLTCSGGRFPAGVDGTYPRKQVYPGVLDFYRELDLGVSGPDAWPVGRTGNLVFLSARPHVYKDISEAHTYSKFKTLQRERGLYTSPSLMAGSVQTGRAYILYNTLEPLAEKKFENFMQFRSIYPEFKCVFIGDNGQGDVRAAEMMVEGEPGALEAIYMHQVLPLNKTFGYSGPETLERWRHMGICFFTRITEAAAAELVCVPFDQPIQRESKRLSINRSIECANALLRNVGLEPIKTVLGVAVYANGAHVLTPYGRGVVYRYRSDDGMYEVVVGECCACCGQCIDFKLKYTVDAHVLTPYGRGVVYRYRSDDGMYEVVVGECCACCGQCIDFKLKYTVDAYVLTPYGRGVVYRYRSDDGMYEVVVGECCACCGQCIDFKLKYTVDAYVLTPYGRGVVYRYRSDDGMHEVVVDWSCKTEAYLDYLCQAAAASAAAAGTTNTAASSNSIGTPPRHASSRRSLFGRGSISGDSAAAAAAAAAATTPNSAAAAAAAAGAAASNVPSTPAPPGSGSGGAAAGPEETKSRTPAGSPLSVTGSETAAAARPETVPETFVEPVTQAESPQQRSGRGGPLSAIGGALAGAADAAAAALRRTDSGGSISSMSDYGGGSGGGGGRTHGRAARLREHMGELVALGSEAADMLLSSAELVTGASLPVVANNVRSTGEPEGDPSGALMNARPPSPSAHAPPPLYTQPTLSPFAPPFAPPPPPLPPAPGAAPLPPPRLAGQRRRPAGRGRSASPPAPPLLSAVPLAIGSGSDVTGGGGGDSGGGAGPAVRRPYSVNVGVTEDGFQVDVSGGSVGGGTRTRQRSYTTSSLDEGLAAAAAGGVSGGSVSGTSSPRGAGSPRGSGNSGGVGGAAGAVAPPPDAAQRFLVRAYLPLSSLRPAPSLEEERRRLKHRLQKERQREAERARKVLQATVLGHTKKKGSFFGSLSKDKSSGSDKLAKPLPAGASARCFMGDITITAYRPDTGIYEATSNSWTLANGRRALLYLRREDVKLPKPQPPPPPPPSQGTPSSSATTPSLVGKAGSALRGTLTLGMAMLDPLRKGAGSGGGAAAAAAPRAARPCPKEGDRVLTQFGPAVVTRVHPPALSAGASQSPSPRAVKAAVTAAAAALAASDAGGGILERWSTSGKGTPSSAAAAAAADGGSTLVSGKTTPSGLNAAAAAADDSGTMLEVTFTSWQLAGGCAAKATLNRDAVWLEGETPPTPAAQRRARQQRDAAPKPAAAVAPRGSVRTMMGVAGGVLSSLGGIISSKDRTSPPASGKPQLVPAVAAAVAAAAAAAAAASSLQKHPTGSLVRTMFGVGLVRRYRARDGVYCVALLNWRLARGACAEVYARGDAFLGVIAEPGHSVVTPLGVGTVVTVRETDGVVVVRSLHATQYLQPSALRGPAPAQVGDAVTTPFGAGRVTAYLASRRTFVVDVGFGTLYSPGGAAILSRTGAGPKEGAASVGLLGSVLKKFGFFSSPKAQ
ncbi:hypothetical protein JKP88DRAFT_263274 [Tribonema minus]|uniref:Phosphatidate phosphatase APP1 catalytic domain-containing protein n=1 Tax=Tribonema minus TaxID=303371 RepID=A0A836CE71_9STRA|nr:hypothetical protein JKP88DRAFT_263274 [Tribonema minus]